MTVKKKIKTVEDFKDVAREIMIEVLKDYIQPDGTGTPLLYKLARSKIENFIIDQLGGHWGISSVGSSVQEVIKNAAAKAMMSIAEEFSFVPSAAQKRVLLKTYKQGMMNRLEALAYEAGKAAANRVEKSAFAEFSLED